MRTRALLTQVLVANLVVISLAVGAAGLLAGSDDLGLATALVILTVAIAATVVFNALLLTRRFAPLERLIEAMERADLSRPGTNLGAATDGRAETEEVARLEVAFRRMLERGSGINAPFEVEGDLRELQPEVQLVLYRGAQEALSNAVRHSGADRIGVRVRRADGRMELTVSDNGRGFSFDEAGGGLGILGMRERALLVGGELGIESRPAGTTVRLVV